MSVFHIQITKATIHAIIKKIIYYRLYILYNRSKQKTEMKERNITAGDIVTVKPEWLNPGEDGATKYVVLEEAGANRILVQALGTGLPIPPTYVYDVDWVSYAGCVSKDMCEH